MLIIVEGICDRFLLDAYIKYLKINKFTIFETEGKDKLKNKLNEKEKTDKNKEENLRKRIDKALDEDEAIKIIFDADKSIEDSLQNIKGQLGNELFLKCKVFLMPNNKDNGNLETLLENIAREKCILKCFDNYKRCIQKIKDKNQNIYLPAKKSKVFAYLESFGFKNGVNNFKINESIIDFENEYLQPLKDFLLDIKDTKDK